MLKRLLCKHFKSNGSKIHESLPDPKPILLLALTGGLALGLLIAADHPVMVWAHGGEWCARFDATGKLKAFKYEKACQVVNHE